MGRFAIVAVSLWIVSAVLVGAALHYGETYSQPSDLQNLGFDLCAAHPCFKQMSANANGQRESTLAGLNVQLVRQSGDITAIIPLDGVDTEVLVKPGSIEITPRGLVASFTVANFIDLYGKPCDMLPGSQLNTVTLLYPKISVEAVIDQGRLSLDSQVISVKFPAATKFQTQCLRVKPWLGFTALWHYVERGVIRPLN
jgi:hypothetical protein